jgi:hypothetical protein
MEGDTIMITHGVLVEFTLYVRCEDTPGGTDDNTYKLERIALEYKSETMLLS